jgi:hypothetical protein
MIYCTGDFLMLINKNVGKYSEFLEYIHHAQHLHCQDINQDDFSFSADLVCFFSVIVRRRRRRISDLMIAA